MLVLSFVTLGPEIPPSILGWPEGLPSRRPGLRRVEGQPAVGLGSTRSRIGTVHADGTFWVQPMIRGEPPRLCVWDSSRVGFRSARWRRAAVSLLRRRASGRFAEVVVYEHRRGPWTVDFTVDINTPRAFSLPAEFLVQGYAYAKNPYDVALRSIEREAHAEHRGMFARGTVRKKP